MNVFAKRFFFKTGSLSLFLFFTFDRIKYSIYIHSRRREQLQILRCIMTSENAILRDKARKESFQLTLHNALNRKMRSYRLGEEQIMNVTGK